MNQAAISGTIAGIAGVSAYYALQACNQVEAALETCVSGAIMPKGNPGTMILELFTNAFFLDISRACPSEYAAYDACRDHNYSGCLVLLSVVAGVFAIRAYRAQH